MIIEANRGARRILVVDDHDASAAVALHALTSCGCRVRVAASGREALRRIRQETPDAVLTDFNLADMPGTELATRAYRTTPEGRRPPRFVIWSATPGLLDMSHPKGPPRCRFLAKPASASEIRQALGVTRLPQPSGQNQDTGLLAAFHLELERELPEIDRRLRHRKFRQAGALVHRLIASSAHCGEHRLESGLRALEQALRTERGDAALAHAWYRLGVAVREFRNRADGTAGISKRT